MELDGWQWTVACVAAFGVGLGKGGLPGLGNLAVALYAMILPPRVSVGVLLPVLICADLVAVLVYRRDADWKLIARLLPWTLVGICIGAIIFHRIRDREVEIVIGAILLGMTALHFIREELARRKNGDRIGRVGDLSLRVGTGLVGGFATMIANAAGPVAALYLMIRKLPKIAFVGTLAWFFMILNWIKVPIFVGIGVIDVQSLPVSLTAGVFAAAGVLVARLIVRRIPQKLFEWLVWIFVIVAGLHLIVG